MVAIVTGGSRGIGKEIVKAFVAVGYKVAFCYNKSQQEAMDLSNQLNGNGNLNCIAIQCDVRNYDSVKNFVQMTLDVFGSIDIVVNNAGIANYNLLMDLSQSEWRNIMSTNLDSAFYMCNQCIPHMLEKGGSIINISSVWGIYGASMEVAYSASKAGLIGLTKALAQEVGSSNIRVNCIAAGVINTDMNKMHSKETIDDLTDRTPLARIGEAEDIAQTAVYLSSSKANFITGQVIEVSGGFK